MNRPDTGKGAATRADARPSRSPALATFGAPRADDALALVGLSVSYRVRGRERDVLTDVSLRIGRGEAYGLVGESGCGKSTVALAVLRYLAHNGRVKSGRIAIAGEDVLKLDREGLRLLRAHKVSMVYQDPASALNPTLTIVRQLSEAFEAAGASPADALDQAHAMLARVRIADPARVMASWPHQLSGGMQQRVVIAMALASNPTLLILDEPTTGLDATVEAEVLALVAQLREELDMAVLLISHDLGVIARMCERVGVLYAGRLVEEGPTQDVFARARHPYTVGLLRCLPAPGRTRAHGTLDTIAGELPAPGTLTHGCIYAPRCRMADARCHEHAPPPHRMEAPHGEQMSRCHYHERAIDLPVADAANAAEAAEASDIDEIDVRASAQTGQPAVNAAMPVVLRATHLSLTFGHGARSLRVLNDVSLELRAGETLGLVGESGSGKTTLAKLLLGVHAADAGGIVELDGQPLAGRLARRNAQALRALRIVFQHPDASLNRALPVNRLVGRALARAGGERMSSANTARIAGLLDAVRVPIRYLNARARQLSGGLKQRVAIAQAFAGDPRVVICDEPTSALDVSVQAAILNLLARLQRERGVSYLFISHDLDVVRYLADRVMVLYAGHVVESGPANAVLGGPCHPYTETLLNAASATGKQPTRDAAASGTPSTGTGCVFSGRCPRKLGAQCDEIAPPFVSDTDGHRIRCHIPAAELRELQRASAVAPGKS
ncbi:peptide/nickel transport system ATP-binding protein [Paraburkholderia eburnea]|uniref:Peptide/nickel transport system ATP-binding protein n=1 Tax=Paraburkholderia eburnea TaxID=1189126 RepID=A0A2S4M073_9BURK|nr:ABC transporter ATP-binding protein [Paraburkholderia eburnea]POR48122.1 peptide/nickel transport system ATP-binding protein [Paraburkholderia eburnea]PRZ22295.1 peptide/nickel transport system ATP-binding protein [Paraburkholderia eburnea]